MTDYNIHFIVNNKYYAMKIQEKSESFFILPEIPCIRSHYLDVRIFRYSDIYSDIYNIYNIYSPTKFSRSCGTSRNASSVTIHFGKVLLQWRSFLQAPSDFDILPLFHHFFDILVRISLFLPCGIIVLSNFVERRIGAACYMFLKLIL